MNRERKGAVTVTSTILYADRFAFYTQAGRFYECYADSPEELHMWMDALPSPMGAKIEGWCYKHKRGAKGSKFVHRYATYEMESGVFNYFTDESRSTPKARAAVTPIPARPTSDIISRSLAPGPCDGTVCGAKPVGQVDGDGTEPFGRS